jgi:hypothetical protein
MKGNDCPESKVCLLSLVLSFFMLCPSRIHCVTLPGTPLQYQKATRLETGSQPAGRAT